MAQSDPTGDATRRRRPVPRWRALAGPLLLLASAVAGCTPAGTLRWDGLPGGPRAVSWRDAAPAAVLKDLPPPPGGAATGGDRARGPAIPVDRFVPAQRTGGALVRAATDDRAPGLPPAIPPGTAPPVDPAAPEIPSAGNPPPAVPPADHSEYPIDLPAALRLAEAENPVIAEARMHIGEALALQQAARALLLPSLNAGVNYHGHVGNLQRSSGRILNLSEQSLYFGGGAGASAAGTVGLGALQDPFVNFASPTLPERPGSVPAVNIASPLTDAFFAPLVARQVVAGARFSATATANRVLLDVAVLHFELQAAYADLAFRRETALQEAEVARLTRAYAEAKQGRQADAERSLTELQLIVQEIHQAEEAVAVTSTRLVHRLHLDPDVRLRPVAPGIEAVTLVDPSATIEGLLQVALRQHPEIGAASANVARAEARHRQEVFRPLLPTVFLGFSGGGFGGGSNLVPPNLGNFAGRTDFDIGLFWTMENFGLGNAMQMKRRRAEVGQAVGQRSEAFAAVRTEVGAALAEVLATRPQLAITADRLHSAEVGFQEDLDRIRNEVGRPVEVVNSLRLLNEARIARVRAVTDNNKAQVRLFVALGTPPPLDRPATAPLPPAPVASPPVGPVSVPPDRGLFGH
jgi:outer membrane protein TolC